MWYQAPQTQAGSCGPNKCFIVCQLDLIPPEKRPLWHGWPPEKESVSILEFTVPFKEE